MTPPPIPKMRVRLDRSDLFWFFLPWAVAGVAALVLYRLCLLNIVGHC